MRNAALSVALLALGTWSAACSGSTTNTTTTNTAANTNANSANVTASNTAPASTPAAKAGSLATPKDSIAYQFDLIKAGDVAKLKTCLTPRVRDGLTQEVVDKAKTTAGRYSLDDLYASAEMGEADGKKTAKVKMKDGKTLTTLIETDGQWLADTLWFK
jgi:hypothetical protein